MRIEFRKQVRFRLKFHDQPGEYYWADALGTRRARYWQDSRWVDLDWWEVTALHNATILSRGLSLDSWEDRASVEL